MKPHKHAELIKAWADGAEIEEWRETIKEWCLEKNPTWTPWTEYRIKPAEKVARWMWARKDRDGTWITISRYFTENEFRYARPDYRDYQKLEWSREEFDE